MSNIHVEIPDPLYETLKATFLDDDQSIKGFAIAALQEYTTWLAGQDRPSTMSEIETKRIYYVYKNILTDRVPTIWEIGEYFNLPLGRSRYIVQNLNYRYPIFMQRRKKEVVIAVLKNILAEKDGVQTVKCPVECSDVLDSAINEVRLLEELVAVPTRHAYTFDVIYQMVDADRLRILAQVESIKDA